LFTLNQSNIANFDLQNAKDFVESWRRYYRADTVEVLDSEQIEGGLQSRQIIDYFKELNVGADLSEENIRRLLRWKDRRLLTQTILSGKNKGKSNPKVNRVLENIVGINQFRNGRIGEDEMRTLAAKIFPKGNVWQFYLLHIAQPHIYPIADVNVFAACALHTRLTLSKPYSWQDYQGYKVYFGKIAQELGIPFATSNIRKLKEIDNALVAFGQFLIKYRLAPKSKTRTHKHCSTAYPAVDVSSLSIGA
jgi:hypothetical protein